MVGKIEKHIKNSSENISNIILQKEKINKVANLIKECKKRKKKILVIGNGGSASDAEHFTGELLCTYASKKRAPFPATCLSSNIAALTAWSNDFNYNTFYKRKITALGNRGDLLIILSTSGGDNKKSVNLVYAAKEAKNKGVKIFSLLGRKGGKLKSISDYKIIVNNFSTAHIQEAHMVILNCVCEYLE